MGSHADAAVLVALLYRARRAYRAPWRAVKVPSLRRLAASALLTLFALLGLLALFPHAAEGQTPPPKLSLPTEDNPTAWRGPGLRLQVGVGAGGLKGLGGAPSGRLIAAIVRVGARLDADWSLMASFQYAQATAAGGLSGLRFAGTLDPTWHVTPHLDLAIGIGFGGIVEGRTGRVDPDPAQQSSLANSYTLPSASPPLPSCSGVGVATLLRGSWMFPLGPASQTGLALELDGQWTGCVDNTGRVEPDTAQPIARRQWWPHVGGTLAWLVGWR